MNANEREYGRVSSLVASKLRCILVPHRGPKGGITNEHE